MNEEEHTHTHTQTTDRRTDKRRSGDIDEDPEIGALSLSQYLVRTPAL
jgi:hypothetical protein